MRGLFVATVAVGAMAVAGDARTATSDRLAVLGPASRTVTLEDAKGGGRVGRLTLLVRNESGRSVRLRIRFFADVGDAPVRLRQPTTNPYPNDRPYLFTERSKLASGTLSVPPRHTTLVPLRFGIGEEGKADLLDGTLVLAAQADPPVRSVFIRVAGEVPAVAEAKKPTVQPPKVTIYVQRWFPGGLLEGARHVKEPLVWLQTPDSKALVLLGSDLGQSMKARVVDQSGTPLTETGLTEHRVQVEDLGGVGSYTGKLTPQAGGTEAITVEGKVRDVVVWPLIVAGIGALLGGLGVTWGQRWRARRLLRSELNETLASYREGLPDSPISPLDGPTSGEAIAALEEKIRDAASEDELQEAAESVRALQAATGTWLKIDRHARRLDDLEKQGFAHRVDAVRQDVTDALDSAQWIPDDAEAVAAIVQQLRRQEAILQAFHDAYCQWPDLAQMAYATEPGAWRDDAKTAQLLGLLRSLKELPEEDGLAAQRRLEELTLTDDRDQVFDLAFAPRRVRVRPTLPVGEAPQSPAALRLLAERLVTPVRRWDRSVATVTFLATVLVFVLGVYDDTFGSWEDYAKAFAAGLVGQIGGATIWNLFPSLRSYRLPVAKPAK